MSEQSVGQSVVTCAVEDGIAQVRLNRPGKLNSLTLPLLHDLAATAHELARDKSLRAVVIAGEGRSFSAGLDFASVNATPSNVVKAFLPRPWRSGMTNDFQEPVWAWRRLPVPVIAAVHGHCYGGGFQIAVGADFRYATADSDWSIMEGRWGLVPDMGGMRPLAELVGLDKAKRLVMTAETFTGADAHDYGLVTELADDPVAAATAFAQRLALQSPDQLAHAKRLLNDSWFRPARSVLSKERWQQLPLLFAGNTKIARKAALAKETPVYQPRR